MTDQPPTQPPAFNVATDEVLAILRSTHPDLVEAAEWKAAAFQTARELDEARARITELEAGSATSEA